MTDVALDELDVPDLDSDSLVEEFARRGWGDGLPLIAPTPDRVAAMVAAVPEDPDEIVGVVPPRQGILTPRSIAVNAVLAGCRPDVMPVLVAVARTMSHDGINLAGVNPTTHPVAPLVIVHGEAVDKLGFNSGAGTFGPGNRANATVGRAVRFMLIHAGGATPGAGDQSTHGQPSKYAFCIAENAAGTPSTWGTYPATVGIDAPSAVTVAAVENPSNIHDMESTTPEQLLDKIASHVTTLGSNHVCLSGSDIYVAISPEHAETIASHRWKRSDVTGYLFQRARLPVRVVRAHYRRRREPRWIRALSDDELMPVTDSADKFRIFVTGGPGRHSMTMASFGGQPTGVTVPLHLP